MDLPGTGNGQMLSRRHTGDTSHHSNDLPLLGEETEDRISVFGVLKNNAMYRTLPADQFFHDFLSLTCRCSAVLLTQDP